MGANEIDRERSSIGLKPMESAMKKLEISPTVQKIVNALGGQEWLKSHAKPHSTGYDRRQLFFSPERGVTYRIQAGRKLATVEVREFRGMEGCVMVDRFRCGIDRLRAKIEEKIVA
jgi:hypothetical protein